jgi:ABC transporter substrate binding protein
MLDMRRRDFVTYLGGAVAWSVAARAQEPVGKAVRIGVLANEWWPPIESLREGLRELGYVESKSLRFDYRWAEGRNDRHPVLAAELVALPVDVIVTLGTPAALAAKGATSRIPIVMGAIGDPVRVGAVTNLARPGGNITGFSSAAFEMEEKRLELLKELLSGRLSRVAVFTTNNPALPLTIQYMQRAAAAFGVTLQPLEVNEAKDFDAHSARSAGIAPTRRCPWPIRSSADTRRGSPPSWPRSAFRRCMPTAMASRRAVSSLIPRTTTTCSGGRPATSTAFSRAPRPENYRSSCRPRSRW